MRDAGSRWHAGIYVPPDWIWTDFCREATGQLKGKELRGSEKEVVDVTGITVKCCIMRGIMHISGCMRSQGGRKLHAVPSCKECSDDVWRCSGSAASAGTDPAGQKHGCKRTGTGFCCYVYLRGSDTSEHHPHVYDEYHALPQCNASGSLGSADTGALYGYNSILQIIEKIVECSGFRIPNPITGMR